MSETDLTTRGVSVPFTPTVLNANWPLPGGIYTLPYGLSVTELYLIIRLVAPDTQALSFRLAIGKINADYTENDTMTEAEIIKSHTLITGSASKLTVAAGAELFLDARNILKALAPNSKSDAFCLHYEWDVDPDFSVTGSIEEYLHGSAIRGVL